MWDVGEMWSNGCEGVDGVGVVCLRGVEGVVECCRWVAVVDGVWWCGRGWVSVCANVCESACQCVPVRASVRVSACQCVPSRWSPPH